jgi:hypothetical protein
LTLEDNGDIDITFNYKPKDAEQKLFDAKFTENAILDFEFVCGFKTIAVDVEFVNFALPTPDVIVV